LPIPSLEVKNGESSLSAFIHLAVNEKLQAIGRFPEPKQGRNK